MSSIYFDCATLINNTHWDKLRPNTMYENKYSNLFRPKFLLECSFETCNLHFLAQFNVKY